MQHHYTNQESDERLVVAWWWKWSWDEDRVGPVEARRHRRRSQAGLVSVDHGREEWWNVELPGVPDMPCTYELLLSQATEFYSHYFLEALKPWRCDLWWVHVCMCAYMWDTLLHFFILPFCKMSQCYVTLNYSVFLSVWQHLCSWQVKTKFLWYVV